jgi:hypothetical protein
MSELIITASERHGAQEPALEIATMVLKARACHSLAVRGGGRPKLESPPI